ncbi:uncharacterized protein V1513DRAFT_450894 [Lipomyces chichibuensis]|uniref:uncharacterized protein n=1 Tax=Lipomyces chichibuensis TaxID=1546026 RepID=UPI0033437F09
MIPRRLVFTGANCSGFLGQLSSQISRELATHRVELHCLYNRLAFCSEAQRYRLFDNGSLEKRHYSTVPNKDKLNQFGGSKHLSKAARNNANREDKKLASDVIKETFTTEDGEKYDVYKVETKAQLAEILNNLPEDAQLMGSKDSSSISALLKRARHGKQGPPAAAAAATPATLSEKNSISEQIDKLKGNEKEEPKLPRKGLGAGFSIVAIMAIAQSVHTFAPENWDQYFAITIPESPFGSTVKLNPAAMIINVFSPANTSEWVLNTFVGFYTFRVLAIVFGNTVTVALGILAAAWANRTTLYEAEKTYIKKIEKKTSGGGIVDEHVKFCKGLDKATSNTTFIFSLASFVGCIFPNAMVPLIGPCPLVALPVMGALYVFCV